MVLECANYDPSVGTYNNLKQGENDNVMIEYPFFAGYFLYHQNQMHVGPVADAYINGAYANTVVAEATNYVPTCGWVFVVCLQLRGEVPECQVADSHTSLEQSSTAVVAYESCVERQLVSFPVLFG